MLITLVEFVTKPVLGVPVDKITNVVVVDLIDISSTNQPDLVLLDVQLTIMVTKLIEFADHVSMVVLTVSTCVMMI